MIRRDRPLVLGLLAILLATSITAIVVDGGQTSVTPAFGGTYVEAVAGVPQYLNPLLAATNVDQDVSRLAFSGLTRQDRNGAVVPDLARTFTTDPTGRIWTFNLRDDATWHDGVPVSADDVVYTVGLVQESAYGGQYSAAFDGVTLTRVDALTVTFTLPDVFAPFASSTALPLLPAHVLEGVGYTALLRHEFNRRPIGTGPFRVAEVDARQVVLSYYDDYYRTKPARTRPYLEQIILRSYRDASEALAALARGEVDGTGGLSPLDAERAESLNGVALSSYPTSDFTALFLNVRPEKVALRDRAVRQAIATAIDRTALLEAVLDERGAVANEFVPEASWAYAPEVGRFDYSPDAARTLLDDADWRDHDGDGVRDRGGTALTLTIATSTEEIRLVAAERIVEDLTAIGIGARVDAVPFAQLVDQVARRRTFDALLVEITVGADPDPYAFFHSSQSVDPGDNFSGFATLPLDRNLESARRTYDRSVRRELYSVVFQTIATEVPVVYLYFADYLYVQARTVSGVEAVPITDPTQRFWDAENWYTRVAPRR